MPWQLIYTSAPRGLLSGQSGFCTVARSADLRPALVQRLEQISSYHYLRVAEAATANRNPTVSAFRLLDLRGAKYYVLTRIQPCGLDFTARTNHLAHHLVFQPDELSALPSPAALLRLWPHWRKSWQGEPRVLEEIDPAGFAAAAKTFLPAQTWARLTGDAGRAAGLLESECLRGCYLVCPGESEEAVLEMFCETLELLNLEGRFPLRPWRYGFTTFLQAEDNPNDFQWRACQENTPAFKQAVTRSAPMIPLRSVRVPGNDLVKRARDGPKPPPPPATGPTATPSSSSTPSTPLSLKRDSSTRSLSAPAPLMGGNQPKQPRNSRPALLDINFSIHSTTLAGIGIFATVVVALLLIKHSASRRPVEQGSPLPASHPSSPVVIAPQPKISAPPTAAPDPKQLNCLVGDGPTYILAVPNLTHFRLPIDSISTLQNLLHRYDRQDEGALPNDIRLEVNTDHWDASPGSPMRVGAWNSQQFSASLGPSECVFDYSEWLDRKAMSLAVQANFENVPRLFSLHFGFSSPSNGDPFRLLIVNENNPPEPLHLARKFVLENHQGLNASLEIQVWERLLTNFKLLADRQWQLQPFLKPKVRLYKDWPPKDQPAAGCELDFADIRQRLDAQRDDLKKKLEKLNEPLARPLGKTFGWTNDNLQSFLTFSPGHQPPSEYLKYLSKLKKTAPTNSWIKQWKDRPDSDQPDEVAGDLLQLYSLWIKNEPQSQPLLSATNKTGVTNYFFFAWSQLGDTRQERESMQNKLEDVRQRLVEVTHVGYIALMIVDPSQPDRDRDLEMIRFE
jgi:hypothetical protein